VGCIGENYYEAILKAMLSVGYTIPRKNILISSGPSRSKVELLASARMLVERGYHLYATEGTHKYFMENGVRNDLLHWPDEEDRHPNTVEFLQARNIDLVINIPKNFTKRELRNGYQIRRNAIDFNIPLITNARVASAFVYAICKYTPEQLAIKSWSEY